MKKPQKNENGEQMKWPQSFKFVSAVMKNSSTHSLRVQAGLKATAMARRIKVPGLLWISESQILQLEISHFFFIQKYIVVSSQQSNWQLANDKKDSSDFSTDSGFTESISLLG